MKTRITELLGITYPIICGGMRWLAKPQLCAAISNAGGLGNLTSGNYNSGDEFRRAINEVRKLTDKPFDVNITFMPSVRITKELHQEYFRICCEEKITALEISGVPVDKYLGPEFISMAKEARMKLMHKVGSVRHAKHAEAVGYDAVIVVGVEEGGHPFDDDVTTIVLTPKACESVGIPVITGGGIADGRTMAAAMVLGAEGVMIASRFAATNECQVHPRFKEELIRRQENDTALICKTINQQMRALKNERVCRVLEIEACHGEFD
ncbi:NAD(P)H-dependent flavin oxidoreductase [Chloroflexota bacterium]